jgi:predicted transcriptional regulator
MVYYDKQVQKVLFYLCAHGGFMIENITLRIDGELLQKLQHLAVDKHLSLSSFVVGILEEKVARNENCETARARALKRLQNGFYLGGKPLTRNEVHGR